MNGISSSNPLLAGLPQTVAAALAEDVGSGDITASLVPEGQGARYRQLLGS